MTRPSLRTVRCCVVQQLDVRRTDATAVGAVRAHVMLHEDGRTLGHATVSIGNGSSTISVSGADGEATRVLVTASLDTVAADGGGVVHWWVTGATSSDDALAASIGLVPGRRLLQLRRSLPTGQPVTVSTRPFRPGADEAAWVDVNNRAFAGHPEQGGWTVDTLIAREAEPWFDPAGFLLHERDGRLAAFCWTKLHEPDESTPERLGEIYVIGVDPDFQGLGLGSQLTLAGLDAIVARGVETAMLYVDADNTTAVAMYERLGFTLHRVDMAFTGEVAPAGG